MSMARSRMRTLFLALLAVMPLCIAAMAYAKGGPPPHAGKGKPHQQQNGGELFLQGITYLKPGHTANSAVLLMPDRHQVLLSEGDGVPGTGFSVAEIHVGHVILEDDASGSVRLDLNDALRLGSELPLEAGTQIIPKGHSWVAKPGQNSRALRVDPVYDNGQLLGVRILPGGNGSQYKHSGLGREDIVLAINGVAMNSEDGLSNLQAVLQAQDELQLLVLRDRELIRLTFSFQR
jgi:type II secretion system protein C